MIDPRTETSTELQPSDALPPLTKVAMTAPPHKRSWPRILLVHGTMDRSTSFKRASRHLTDYEVVSYDRRGYGISSFTNESGAPRKVSWQIHLHDLTEIVSEKPTVVFGHSYGGSLALLAAERHAENLLGIATFESPLSWLPNWSRWSESRADPNEEIDPGWARLRVREFMIAQIGEKNWNRLPSATKLQRESEGVTMISEMRSMAHLSPVLDPTRIDIPAIVARSKNAPERHVRGAAFLSEKIPNAEIRIVPDTDHGVHLKQPAKLAELVKELISRC